MCTTKRGQSQGLDDTAAKVSVGVKHNQLVDAFGTKKVTTCNSFSEYLVQIVEILTAIFAYSLQVLNYAFPLLH